MLIEEIDINSLKEAITTISPIQCDYYSEACAVALENQNNKTGVSLSVSGEQDTQYLLLWKSPLNTSGWKESKKSTENAAVAISFFLTKKLTVFNVIEEAVIGTGIDYWLGYDEDHPDFNELNFLNARLEISGIAKESPTNTFEGRIKDKINQTKPSDNTNLPAYVSVVEFSTPKAHFIKK